MKTKSILFEEQPYYSIQTEDIYLKMKKIACQLILSQNKTIFSDFPTFLDNSIVGIQPHPILKKKKNHF